MQLYSIFNHLCTLCGGRVQAYNPIVGAGKDGAVLHFRTGSDRARAYSPIQNDSLVLIDAGPEFRGYASDLTRTWWYVVRSGTEKERLGQSTHPDHHRGTFFSSLGGPAVYSTSISDPKKALMFSIVEKTQSAAIQTFFTQGSTWAQVDATAVQTFTRELVSAGFFNMDQVDVERLIQERVVHAFMPHGLGHPVILIQLETYLGFFLI